MKKLAFIILSICLLALSSCSTTKMCAAYADEKKVNNKEVNS